MGFNNHVKKIGCKTYQLYKYHTKREYCILRALEDTFTSDKNMNFSCISYMYSHKLGVPKSIHIYKVTKLYMKGKYFYNTCC